MSKAGQYRIQDAERGIIGPISLETVRDLFRSGVAGADARVSLDGGPFEDLGAHPDLAAFAQCDLVFRASRGVVPLDGVRDVLR